MERDEKGRFIKGAHPSKKTEFVKGQNWRKEKPYWNKEWLYEEYINKQRSCSEIAKDFNITEASILFWLRKLGIERRSVSQARDIKYWGNSGEDNPMFGKRGDEVPSWKGGCTPERQSFYNSQEWKNCVILLYQKYKIASCAKCGSNESIHIHHIISFSVKEYRADVNNLIFLCQNCHRWVHSKENINKEYIIDVHN